MKFIPQFLAPFVLVLLLALTGCPKPTYVDPVTGDVVACSELPALTIQNTIAEIKAVLEKDGWASVYTYVIGKGAAIGGCALAEFVTGLLAPPPGIAVPPPEVANDARRTLEEVRAHFNPNLVWVNKDGVAQ